MTVYLSSQQGNVTVMEAFLIHIGIAPADVFAGFTGGVLAGLVTSGARPNVWGIFCSVVIGVGAASYGGPVLPLYVGMKPTGFTSFVIGLAGTPIVKAIIAVVTRFRWSPLEKKTD